ncbi:hypothetical protein ZYGR_0AK07760 [Zygosaccharomyces rouxii]|uniref:Uncharacterized protein n=1 Tax=Zygosaccharomyces rouxii TaxID=4956 RepID=A0A1Q3AFL9_ZYGRO|nr:hypothetical protein ZYGR_0AK07760 [Zygosaccharomyces rouxii]
MEKDNVEDSPELVLPNKIFRFKLTWMVHETIINYPRV